MKRINLMRGLIVFMLAAMMAAALPFVSLAAAVPNTNVPVTLHLDVNNRQTAIYDGYTSYVMGNRASEYDTFTITKDDNNVDLNQVVLKYYLITYEGNSQKYLECRVTGLKEGEHYPVVRPETVSREKEAGKLYDSLERCYVVELSYGDARKTFYFMLFPEEEMADYRNIHLGKWEQESRGWRYLYQGNYLTSWALINDKWYLFDMDGYMKIGWQEYKGKWYYLDLSNGVMKSNCTVDGYQLDSSGARI